MRPTLSSVLASALASVLLTSVATTAGCVKDDPGGAGSTGGANGSGGASSTGGRGAGTGGAPGTGGAGSGTGGTVGTGGSNVTGTGGTTTGGTGGVTGTGGAGTGGTATGGTGNGSGGASGGRGGAGTGGTAGGPGTGGTGGPVDCATLPLCDTFESTAVGAAPSSTLWTIIPASGGGTATVDSMGAHGSSRSVKIVSPDRFYLRNSTAIKTVGAVAHVRFHVRFGSALPQGHSAFIVTHPIAVDQYTQQPELRLGGQDAVFHWNTDSDAANIPNVDPTNGDPLSFKPAANVWYCVELTINTSNGHLNVSVDGMDKPGLAADGVPTMHIDQAWLTGTTSTSRYTALADFNIGWQSYGAGAMTLWFDDIALSGSPIGCP